MLVLSGRANGIGGVIKKLFILIWDLVVVGKPVY